MTLGWYVCGQGPGSLLNHLVRDPEVLGDLPRIDETRGSRLFSVDE